ncbi:MAG: right-handed parallel beta-helix repeat-containing protein [Bacteroidaceae bacterium]|nr:right-handed parallel beta-helix repeat-containing protein [Bacteroidaceae bacterium]
MKKILFVLVATSITMAAQAKILRVSNVPGSSAPYKGIYAAIHAAEEGDTIMVDASSTTYDNVTIDKRVVLLGPGYWLQENGIIQEGGETASASIWVGAKGVIIKGMTLTGLTIQGDQTVISRCRVLNGITIDHANNCIIHQNYCMYVASYSLTDPKTSNHQITNNIMTGNTTGFYMGNFTNTLFAYNTCIGTEKPRMMGSDGSGKVLDCTIEHNVFIELPSIDMSNSMNNNTVPQIWPYKASMTDKEVQKALSNLTDGAFAGDDPYVLSGVPAGPVVQDLIVPVTVEKGSKMSVTVKVGVVK